ncbi:MAG: GNAT family N-acetyltransferase [Pirellulales bacterium]
MKNYSIEIQDITKYSCNDLALEEISSIHQKVLKDGFLSSLGRPFLRSIYRELANDPQSCLLCALQNNNIVGFICGTTNTSAFYKRYLKQNIVRGIFTLLPKFLSFQFLKKIIETLTIPTRTKQIELPTAQLLNFCVSERCQGNGIGGLLFNRLTVWFHSKNISEVTIITGKEQKIAQRFYHRQGLKEYSTVEIHDNNESVVFIWKPKADELVSPNSV